MMKMLFLQIRSLGGFLPNYTKTNIKFWVQNYMLAVVVKNQNYCIWQKSNITTQIENCIFFEIQFLKHSETIHKHKFDFAQEPLFDFKA